MTAYMSQLAWLYIVLGCLVALYGAYLLWQQQTLAVTVQVTLPPNVVPFDKARREAEEWRG